MRKDILALRHQYSLALSMMDNPPKSLKVRSSREIMETVVADLDQVLHNDNCDCALIEYNVKPIGEPGLYVVYWKDGEISPASVYRASNGLQIACATRSFPDMLDVVGEGISAYRKIVV